MYDPRSTVLLDLGILRKKFAYSLCLVLPGSCMAQFLFILLYTHDSNRQQSFPVLCAPCLYWSIRWLWCAAITTDIPYPFLPSRLYLCKNVRIVPRRNVVVGKEYGLHTSPDAAHNGSNFPVVARRVQQSNDESRTLL
jgi:hypothetical protein